MPRGGPLPRKRARPRRTAPVVVEELPDLTGLDLETVIEMSTAVDPLWPLARRVALRRDRSTCCRCGQPGNDVHHRVAKKMGGRMNDPDRHAPERLVTLCRSCHSWVHGNPAAAGEAGFVVFSGEEAHLKPVTMYHGKVLLGKDGRMSTTTVRFGR